MKRLLSITVLVLAAMMASAATHWASVTSDSYAELDPVGSSAHADRYAAYLCTAATAATLFAGATDIDGVTLYLSENYGAALGALHAASATAESGVSALETPVFADGQYSLTQYFAEGLAGDYLAVLTYAYAGERGFRVFGNEAAEGSALFDPDVKTGGTAGAWTEAPPVPEPAGGLLLLLGAAALALRRRHAV